MSCGLSRRNGNRTSGCAIGKGDAARLERMISPSRCLTTRRRIATPADQTTDGAAASSAVVPPPKVGHFAYWLLPTFKCKTTFAPRRRIDATFYRGVSLWQCVFRGQPDLDILILSRFLDFFDSILFSC